MDINKFESVKSRDLYYQYFSLILRQNKDISKNREIITLYDRLDNDLKNDRDLIYMRLKLQVGLKILMRILIEF